MSRHLLLSEAPLTVLTRFLEVHLLNVVLLIVDINKLSALFAFADVPPAIGVVAVNFALGEVPQAVFAFLECFGHWSRIFML